MLICFSISEIICYFLNAMKKLMLLSKTNEKITFFQIMMIEKYTFPISIRFFLDNSCKTIIKIPLFVGRKYFMTRESGQKQLFRTSLYHFSIS